MQARASTIPPVRPASRADPDFADAPVVDFVGGSRSSVAHAGLGARRQMRRHARQLAADRVDAAEGYFAFLRVVLRLVFFAVFFAADFVLDLALFAILPS